ncbi:MAG: hypothetical protein HGA96_16740 [Desulfobulbaceae bacterium]|nr:hypothetical protein [Desulfobulbaceae bacterium]
MQVKGKAVKLVGKLGVAGALLLASGLAANYALAEVVGECAMCHTMHNSQSGNPITTAGTGASWDAGVLSGGSNGVQSQLLRTDCVGCHSNTGGETILTVGGNDIPIVYNLSGYPAQPLAGGNFAAVAGNSNMGHDVRGINNVIDPNHAAAFAPGAGGAPGHVASGCANSCHVSFTLDDSAVQSPGSINAYKFAGCRGCHTRIAHHNPSDPSYRYLGGHNDNQTNPGVIYVEAGGLESDGPGHNPYEAADWEQNPSAVNHNFYRVQSDLNEYTTISSMCYGCHNRFHAMGVPDGNHATDNGGDDNTDDTPSVQGGNPWMRHPTGVRIPNGGEYANLLSGTTPYNPTIPVTRVDGETSPVLVPGDQVFCLSCHRAHGSQYDDALRFDYSTMNAHSYAGGNTEGCFYCHNTKDTP